MEDSKAPFTVSCERERVGRFWPPRRPAFAAAAVLGSVPMLLTLAAMAGLQHSPTGLRSFVPGSAVTLLEYPSAFGPALAKLTVSGFSCPGGANSDFNGEYEYQGLTGEGRPWYKRSVRGWCGESYVLFFDREFDGEVGGTDNWYGEWVFKCGDEHLHLDHKEMIDERGGDHRFNAWLQMRATDKSGKLRPRHPIPNSDFSRLAGAAPPAKAKWGVWCGHEDEGWSLQEVSIAGGGASPVHVEGDWVFLYTAMPKQKVKLHHGKKEKTNLENAWHVEGSAGIDMGGEVCLAIFGPEAESSAHADISASFQRQWASESTRSEEESTTFELPETEGSALWQWILTARAHGGEEGRVLTQQFAFTASGTAEDKPKCYPGGSTDHYRYQMCYPGWWIP